MMWKDWNGGPMPVSPESLVRVQIRACPRSKAENSAPFAARCWRWKHDGGPGDVIAWQQIGEVAK